MFAFLNCKSPCPRHHSPYRRLGHGSWLHSTNWVGKVAGARVGVTSCNWIRKFVEFVLDNFHDFYRKSLCLNFTFMLDLRQIVQTVALGQTHSHRANERPRTQTPGLGLRNRKSAAPLADIMRFLLRHPWTWSHDCCTLSFGLLGHSNWSFRLSSVAGHPVKRMEIFWINKKSPMMLQCSELIVCSFHCVQFKLVTSIHLHKLYRNSNCIILCAHL